MQYDKLYEMYQNGEIDEDEFVEAVYGGLEYDLDERRQKPRRKKMKKRQFEEEESE